MQFLLEAGANPSLQGETNVTSLATCAEFQEENFHWMAEESHTFSVRECVDAVGIL